MLLLLFTKKELKKFLEIITKHPETFIIKRKTKTTHYYKQIQKKIMTKEYELENIIEHDLQDEMRLYNEVYQQSKIIISKINKNR